MKRLFTCAVVFAASLAASAQFTNTSRSSSTTIQSDGWNTVYVQYNPTFMRFDVDGADNVNFKGFALGYNKAFSVSKSMPLYVEGGVGIAYIWHNDDATVENIGSSYNVTESTSQNIKLWSLKVPISILYDFQIPNSDFSITPYAGINFRYNLSGKQKIARTWVYTRNETGEIFSTEEESGECSLFDKEEMEELAEKVDMEYGNSTYKRLQVGWHVGVNAKWNKKYMIGFAYCSDFSEITEKTKLSNLSISLGYCF